MIGEMRHRVAVRSATQTNNLGVLVDSWSTIETVYASIRMLRADEVVNASQTEGIYTHEFTMRYRDDLGTADTEMLNKYRLLFRGDEYDVRAVDNIEFRDKYIVVKAERRK